MNDIEKKFRIMVIGSLKSGKSTFINAMVGERLLPAFTMPCTAVISEIKYSDEKRALLHFKNPIPKKINEKIYEKIRRHIEKYDKQSVPPMEIPIEVLKEYIVYPFETEEERIIPFEKIEILYPTDFCKNGVEIIDSPGLNNRGSMTEITEKYLSKVDAIVFIFNCIYMPSKTEKDFIENNILAWGHQYLFLIGNKIDYMKDVEEREEFINEYRSSLSKYTKLKANGIFFTSGGNALTGRIEKNNEILEESGILEFEKELKKCIRRTNKVENNYVTFNVQKDQALSLYKETIEVLNKLKLRSEIEKLEPISNKLNNDTFKVMIVGTFKNGKSTFINAMIGEKILPAFTKPCTAVISEIKYSDEKKALLHFKNQIPKKINEKIFEKVKIHIEKYGKQNIPPMEIPIEKLKEYIIIPNPAEIEDESIPEEERERMPYEKIEIFYPLELCKNGVEIIDSPGLNDRESMTEITEKYLSKVDAIVFIFDCTHMHSKTEKDFIENNILAWGHQYLFLIGNKIDNMKDVEEREEFINEYRSSLSKYTKLKENGIFFTSGGNALTGRIEKNKDILEKSGVLEFENKLAEYLTNNRGKIKLKLALNELQISTKKVVSEVIPNERAMLSCDLNKLIDRYNKAKPALENLEKEKTIMTNKIDESIKRLFPMVKRELELYFYSLKEKIKEFNPNVNLENKINLFGLKKSAEKVTSEFAQMLQKQMEEYQAEWIKNDFNPKIQSELEEIVNEFKINLEAFYLSAENIKVNITEIDSGIKEANAAEKATAVIAGLMFGNIEVAVVGGALGIGAMIKQLLVQIGIITALVAVGVTNPLTIVPVLIASAAFQLFTKGEGIENKIKEKVKLSFCDEIDKKKNEMIEEISSKMISRIRGLFSNVGDELESEIKLIKTQIEEVIAEKRKGEMAVKQKESEITILEKSTNKIINEIQNFFKAIEN